ncbi:hypothetical protein C8T65DRAFT_827973 [Cerioporus squamosus]|nr:hypothetical protein C8T65DRAFT_827973 [Cerioporus squamosus]
MLSLTLAILLHVHLAEAPGHPLDGSAQELLIMAFPTLAVITVVPRLALTRSTIPSALESTVSVYVVNALAAIVALGHSCPQLFAHGPRGILSAVKYLAELVQRLRVFLVIALGIIARAALRMWLHIGTVYAVPVVARTCPSWLSCDQLLLDQAADSTGFSAARSAAADTEARLAPKEDDVAQVKGSLDAVKTHTEAGVDVEELKAKIAARRAEIAAAHQDAAAVDARVEELKRTVNAANTGAETTFSAEGSLSTSHRKLKDKIEHLQRVIAGDKLRAERAQDDTNLAQREAAFWTAKADDLEIVAERQLRELEQKDKMLESRKEQIAGLKQDDSTAVNAEDAEEVVHWKNRVAVLEANLKACDAECADILEELAWVKKAY